MSKKADSKIDSLKASLGDLLVGPLGEQIAGLQHLRTAYHELHSNADAELASTIDIRSGDTDVPRHKKAVKEKEGELRTARGQLDAAAQKLGEEVCVAHSKGELTDLVGLEEVLSAREALRALRADYANLEPKPNAGLWAKGKAAALRLVVSGKIVLQEAKANDLYKKLVCGAFDQGKGADLQCPHTAAWVEKVKESYAHVERRKAALDVTQELFAEVEKRCRDIQHSDTRVESIRQQATKIKQEMVQNCLDTWDSTGTEGIAERLTAVYSQLKIARAEAEAAAVKEAQEPKGFFGAIAKALSPVCTKCKQKGLKRIASKVVEREDRFGMAWQTESGMIMPYNQGSFAGSNKRMVQAMYEQTVSHNTFECPHCGHQEVRVDVKRELKI